MYIRFECYNVGVGAEADLNNKARSEENILGGSTLLIERFSNRTWHHQL